MIRRGIALALLASSPALAREPQGQDISASSIAMARYRLAVAEDQSLIEPAQRVCRLAFSEGLRGLDITARALMGYNGPGHEVLSLVCAGYLQGATDMLKFIPRDKESP